VAHGTLVLAVDQRFDTLRVVKMVAGRHFGFASNQILGLDLKHQILVNYYSGLICK